MSISSPNNLYHQPVVLFSTQNNNPFEVGDKVRCIVNYYEEETNSPKIGEEYIITCVECECIGFVSKYPILNDMCHEEIREGKEAWWPYDYFKLIEKAEDIPFNNQMNEILEVKK